MVSAGDLRDGAQTMYSMIDNPFGYALVRTPELNEPPKLHSYIPGRGAFSAISVS